MSTMQTFGKGIVRVAKNYTKGYSDVQAKVRDATSNDPWGPSGTQMNEIAQLTYNQNDFIEIMEMLDKRLNDKGKNWRHVFKSLTVLDYLLHAGSENVVIYFKDNLYIIKTLKEFQFIDEDGKDQGANVRQKAKDITNLLMDEGRLRHERKSRASMRDRMLRGLPGEFDEADDENARRRSRSVPPGGSRRRGTGADDNELQRAIEESKRTADEERRKQGMLTAEERDLQAAIRLSEEEEAKRAKAVEDANKNALFDDQNNLLGQQSTNPFPLVDTGSQPFGNIQPQFTVQPQYTSFNPYQQQAQQEAMQAEYMRQQAEWMRQQQEQQALAQQQALQQAQQEEWLRQQQQQQQQQQHIFQMQQQQQFLSAQPTLMSQPTGFGSNNPFAAAQAQQQQPSPIPSFTQSPVSQNPPSFNLSGTYAGTTSPPPPSHSAPPSSQQQQLPQVKTRTDEQHAHLADLFANAGAREDGIDTFGNFGALRYGQQASRLIGQPTGTSTSSHNPFALQQQQQQQQQGEQPFFSI